MSKIHSIFKSPRVEVVFIWLPVARERFYKTAFCHGNPTHVALVCDQVLDTSSQGLRETVSKSGKNMEEVGIRREERRDSVGKVGLKI